MRASTFVSLSGHLDGDIDVIDLAGQKPAYQAKEMPMQSLTTIVLILGLIAVVASWIVAVRVIQSDEAAGTLISPTAHLDSAHQDELAKAAN